nr:MAG TPA: hypothetical protein [Caudoviricetes sp.]
MKILDYDSSEFCQLLRCKRINKLIHKILE